MVLTLSSSRKIFSNDAVCRDTGKEQNKEKNRTFTHTAFENLVREKQISSGPNTPWFSAIHALRPHDSKLFPKLEHKTILLFSIGWKNEETNIFFSISFCLSSFPPNTFCGNSLQMTITAAVRLQYQTLAHRYAVITLTSFVPRCVHGSLHYCPCLSNSTLREEQGTVFIVMSLKARYYSRTMGRTQRTATDSQPPP